MRSWQRTSMDSSLIRAFRRGDHDALDSVYRLYVGDVERTVRQALLRIGRLQAANLADIVQEVFLKAFSAAGREGYDGLRDYAPYLMRIARNVFIDWARRLGPELPGSHLLEVLDSGAHSTALDETIFPSAVIALTNSYLANLPPELRAVHEQRFVLAVSQQQAAKTLGISRQSLRTLEKKLVAGLQRELRRAGLEPKPEAPTPTISNQNADDFRKESDATALTIADADARQGRQG
jgi:RNA polymerase sigma factor (sigma-70 family)